MSAAYTGPPADTPPAGRGGVSAATTRSPLTVTSDGSAVVIAVEQCLDEPTGLALIDASTAAVDTGPTRLDIDLRGIDSFTETGAQALVACRTLGSKLPEGLHYRTGRGPGREALLAAYRDADTGSFEL
ncbi:MAG TPA: hypothetical protein VE575_04505 [Acidimicrobiales bacterium]|jgi:hypothetical protein|nr:hypothetical protein [Acidimicrobiales bacterium]